MTDPRAIRSLVERAKGGDTVAFDRVVDEFRERLRGRIKSWVQFRLGPRLDIDDVLQDAFVRAFRGLNNFEWIGDDAFFRWLCGVAKNALADAARRAKRDALRKRTGLHVSKLAADDVSQSREMRRQERFDRLGAAIDQLPQEYREVLALARLEGLTMKEIAVRMGRTPNAVKHLIARALRALRKQFGDTESFHLPDRRLRVNGEPHEE